MSLPLKFWVRALPAAFAIFALGGGCIRSEEPEHFRCELDADCDAGEKCNGSYCVAKDSCTSTFDCRGQVCRGEKCVEPQCRVGDGQCGNFECVDGACGTFCNGSYQCKPNFECSNARCELPTGSGGSGNTPFKGGIGSSCMTGNDCQSGFCCARSASSNLCAAELCPFVQCFTTSDCDLGESCVDKLCVEILPNGGPCANPSECLSQSCVGGVCRGTASQGADCSIEEDCQSGRLCCPSLFDANDLSCGELNHGCPGGIGDQCEFDFDCLEGDCNGVSCTKACVNNQDCGNSPWGQPNGCETNGLGNRTCFPGCTSTNQCWDNLGDSTVYCVKQFDSMTLVCVAD